MTKNIRVFDMFCGGGGSSRGAVMAGAAPVGAIDIWKLAADTYSLNFPTATVYHKNATSVQVSRIAKEVGRVDLLLASPECTSHSVAKGNKPGCESSRETAFAVIRFAKAMEPRWIVVENVIQMQHWHRFHEWKTSLEDLGYHIVIGTLDAQFHGTPQARRRLFVVCDREQTPSLPKPSPQSAKTVQKSVLGCGQDSKNLWKFSYVRQPGRAKATIRRAENAISELGKRTPFIMVYYGSDGSGGFQTLDRPLRTITTLDRFAYVRPNKNGHEMRMLQPPELAAAMGFPAEHVWASSSRRERIHLIGNAVCPPVMKDVVAMLVSR